MWSEGKRLGRGDQGPPTPAPHSQGWSQGSPPHPPQRPGQGLVERLKGSGVTVHRWVGGQRFADNSLGGIDPVGEVTELCPLPRAVGMGWWSASWMQQSPPQNRLLGTRGRGYTAPLMAPSPSTGGGPVVISQGILVIMPELMVQRAWACVARRTAGTWRLCAPAPRALTGMRQAWGSWELRSQKT